MEMQAQHKERVCVSMGIHSPSVRGEFYKDTTGALPKEDFSISRMSCLRIEFEPGEETIYRHLTAGAGH